MAPTWLVGLDLGGGSIRCAFLDADSGEVVSASRPFAGEADPQVPVGTRFDPERTWALLAECAREAGQRAGARPDQVRGVACSGFRHGSVLVDAADRVLLACTNQDARGAGAMLGLDAETCELLLARTGRWPYPILPAGRLAWIAAERPDWLERACHLSVSDWLGLRLSGERATDPTQAGETLLLDLVTRDWAQDLIARLGLPLRILPPVREPGTPLGPLRDAAAEALALPPGLPVAVGAADTQSALLGAGALAAGAVTCVAGTTMPVQRVVERPLADARLWTGQAPLRGRFVLESNLGSGGEAAAWLASTLFAESQHPLLHALAAAAEAPPGAGGLLSTFGVQVMNARVPELPIGQLSLSTFAPAHASDRRGALSRALFEGLGHGLRANLEQIAELSGPLPERVHVVGGLSRSAFFTQLLADLWQREVEAGATPEATALGAALCAGVAAGVYRDLEEASRTGTRPGRRHAPEPTTAPLHRELYPAWRAVWEAGSAARVAAVPHVLRNLTAAAPAGPAHAGSSRPHILVASDMDERGLAALRELGSVEYASFRDKGRLLTGDALAEALRGVQVFVTEIDVLNAEGLAACDDLRVVAVCRGDAVNVDLAACTALGIPVVHTPGRNADAVADLTLAFLLMLARKLVPANAFLREPGGEAGDLGRMGKAFVGFQGRELWRKTVGLVGLGAVGRKVLERLRGFGARCQVCDPFLPPDAVRLAGAEPVALDALLRSSDFVSLHAPVTDATRGLVGSRELALMKPDACLVNTARAALVDEAALVEALAAGRLGGAALDVFPVEPPASDHPLLAFENVIATPHLGGNTRDVAAHQGEIVAAELARLCRGERPLHLLNPETLAGFSFAAPRPAPPEGWLERIAAAPGPAVTDLQRDAGKSG